MVRNNKKGSNVAIIGIGETNMSYGVVASLLQQDATVVVPVQSSHHLNMLDRYLKGYNKGKIVTILTDLPDYDKTIELVEMVIEEYGPINIIISPFNYASVNADFSHISIIQWQRAVEENLAVYFIFCRAAIDAMKKCGRGMFVAIVNMEGLGSKSDNRMTEMLVAGQMKMARSFFEEVKNTGVKFYHLFINNLNIDPEQQEPGSKIITPEMIAQYILHIHKEDDHSLTSPFLFLMGKPDPNIDQFFKNN
ncbi:MULTISPECIES: SDR family NAD(P)-dependent oxidoreductase [Niastella]|uniref:Peroxisomal trans-2-enoyl-CoA reductase n=1 Tax=Niastella soli TaxID=2821487 RepID=A0ABS3Z0X9_9BACT|nr:SDR family NAD(P)-dependent oxidoreductase [Niastella soli]MBO9203810.1 SDR family NAD(P)-dependent oxidoreductase [Niastella soli]